MSSRLGRFFVEKRGWPLLFSFENCCSYLSVTKNGSIKCIIDVDESWPNRETRLPQKKNKRRWKNFWSRTQVIINRNLRPKNVIEKYCNIRFDRNQTDFRGSIISSRTCGSEIWQLHLFFFFLTSLMFQWSFSMLSNFALWFVSKTVRCWFGNICIFLNKFWALVEGIFFVVKLIKLILLQTELKNLQL